MFDPPIIRGRAKAAAEAACNAAQSGSEGDVASEPADDAAFSPIRGFDGDPDVLAIRHKIANRYAFLKLALLIFAAPLVGLAMMFGGREWGGLVILILLAGGAWMRSFHVEASFSCPAATSVTRGDSSGVAAGSVRRVLEPYTEVTLTAEKRSQERETTRVHYCVRLDGETDPLDVQETQNESDARDIANRVARFLGRPLHDFTKSASPGQTKELLRLRIFQSRDGWSLPALPADTRIRMKRTDAACVFRIPARGLGWSILGSCS